MPCPSTASPVAAASARRHTVPPPCPMPKESSPPCQACLCPFQHSHLNFAARPWHAAPAGAKPRPCDFRCFDTASAPWHPPSDTFFESFASLRAKLLRAVPPVFCLWLPQTKKNAPLAASPPNPLDAAAKAQSTRNQCSAPTAPALPPPVPVGVRPRASPPRRVRRVLCNQTLVPPQTSTVGQPPASCTCCLHTFAGVYVAGASCPRPPCCQLAVSRPCAPRRARALPPRWLRSQPPFTPNRKLRHAPPPAASCELPCEHFSNFMLPAGQLFAP